MLQGKIVLVTGAGSGIGQAAYVMFAKHGASVLAADINEAAAGTTVDMLRMSGGTAEPRHCDVSDEKSVASLIAFAIERFGRLDGAVNNAGIEMRGKPVFELTGQDWCSVIDVDLNACSTASSMRSWRCAKPAAVPS
jgi:NAD(P)-dependent dehydrogenase (short-subunit alcohol dehydrogenase family)